MAISITGLATGVQQSSTNLQNLLSGNTTAALQLGSFSFQSFEVPNKIDYGANQQVTVHKLPGGRRIIDVLGTDPHDITWEGIFLQANALSRQQQLTAIRDAGQVVSLTFGQFSTYVLISDLRFTYQQSNLIRYSITCTVAPAPANALQTANVIPSGPYAQLSATLASVNAKISDVQSTVQGYVSQVQSVVGGITNVISPLTSALGVSLPGLSTLNLLAASGLNIALPTTTNSAQSSDYASLDDNLAQQQAIIVSGMVASNTALNQVAANVVANPQASLQTGIVGSAADLLNASAALGAQYAYVTANGYTTSARTGMVLSGQVPTTVFPNIEAVTNDLVSPGAPTVSTPLQAFAALSSATNAATAANISLPVNNVVTVLPTVPTSSQAPVTQVSAATLAPLSQTQIVLPSGPITVAILPTPPPSSPIPYSTTAASPGGAFGRLVTATPSDIDAFHVAAAVYGDATNAWQIMAANGLLDPLITKTETLLVPNPVLPSSDGVPPQIA